MSETARADVVYNDILKLVKKRCREAEKISSLLKENKALFVDGKKNIDSPIGAGKSTLLHSAAWFTSVPVAEALLDVSANPNATNVKGNSPLHLACQKLPQSKAIVEMLVKAGGNRYASTHDGKTPTNLIPPELKEWFLGLRPLDENEKATKGNRPVSSSGRDGSAKIKKEAGDLYNMLVLLIGKKKCREQQKILDLIARNKKIFFGEGKVKDINTPTGSGKSTLLHSAAWFVNTPIVQALLDVSANPNIANIKLNTPLHLACEKLPESKKIVELMVSHNGNRYLQTVQGKTAVSIVPSDMREWLLGLRGLSPEEVKAKADAEKKKAISADQANLLDPAKKKLAVEIYGQLSTLVVKKKCREEQVIVSLLDQHKQLFCGSIKYMSIDSPSSYGIKVSSSSKSTLLHSAVWYLKLPVVKALLSCLASPNAKNVKGNTPLHLACEKLPDSEDIVRALVEHGRNRFLANGDGKTPVKSCPPDKRIWLLGLRELDKDEEISKKNNKSPRSARTSARRSARSRKADEVHEELVQLAIKKRCRDPGRIQDLISTNQMLFKGEAKRKDIDSAIGPSKSTLLHSAAWFTSVEVAQALLSVSANPNSVNVKKNTPLHLACEKLPDSKSVVELLVAHNANRFLRTLEGKTSVLITPPNLRDWLLGLRALSAEEIEAKQNADIELKEKRDLESVRRVDDAKQKLVLDVYEQLENHIVRKKCRDEQSIVSLIDAHKNLFCGSFKNMIDSPASFGGKASGNKSTLLHSAVWYQKLVIVKALVSCMASPNAQNIKGNTALHLACEKLPDGKDIVHYLVMEANGNRGIGNSEGKSPVDTIRASELKRWILGLKDFSEEELASQRQMRRARRRTPSKESKRRQFEREIEHIERLRIQLIDLVNKKYCKNPDAIVDILENNSISSSILDKPINSSKQSFLHVAAKLASNEVVLALLKAKASVGALDLRDNTPLHLACEKLPKSKEVVLNLVMAGANRYLHNAQKESPSSYVPARLRAWFMQAAPITKDEQAYLESKLTKSAGKGIDVALMRLRFSQNDSKDTGTMNNETVIHCLTDGGMDADEAEKNIKDYLRQHKDQSEDAIIWKVFLNEFIRMKLFHCIIKLASNKVFGRVDKDKSLSLSLKEFSKHLEEQIGREESKKQSSRLFHKIDSNHDGVITKFELRTWYRERLKALRRGSKRRPQ